MAALALAFPLSTRLTGAEKNNASAWPPAGAGSAKVVDLQSRFQPPDIFPAVVVCQRATGLTAADRAKAADDRAKAADGAQPVSHRREHGVLPPALPPPDSLLLII